MSNVDIEGERNFKLYLLGQPLLGFHFSREIICYFIINVLRPNSDFSSLTKTNIYLENKQEKEGRTLGQR